MDFVKNICKKFIAYLLCVFSIIEMTMGISGLSKHQNIAIIGGADGPTALYVAGKKPQLESLLSKIASCTLIIATISTALLALFKRYSANKGE